MACNSVMCSWSVKWSCKVRSTTIPFIDTVFARTLNVPIMKIPIWAFKDNDRIVSVSFKSNGATSYNSLGMWWIFDESDKWLMLTSMG